MKENSGGIPEYAFDDNEDGATVTPVVHFDFRDDLEDVISEMIALKKPIRPWLFNQASKMAREEAGRMLCRSLAMLMEARDPKLFIHQLQWACGMTIETGPELARTHGVSKQAFQQGAKRIVAGLKLRAARYMRDELAAKKMSLANARRRKI